MSHAVCQEFFSQLICCIQFIYNRSLKPLPPYIFIYTRIDILIYFISLINMDIYLILIFICRLIIIFVFFCLIQAGHSHIISLTKLLETLRIILRIYLNNTCSVCSFYFVFIFCRIDTKYLPCILYNHIHLTSYTYDRS